MQLVCKIKSEIIIIIIIDTMPQSATTVKPMEIKKALLLLYQMLLIRRFEEKWQSTKSKIRGFCICILAKKPYGRRYAGLNGGG
jgi:hypothetical protein